MSERITRRAMLAALPLGLGAATNPPARKVRPLPNVGEFFRFADPTTENPVVRLTNPAATSLLPAPTNRFVSTKDRFLVFSSNRAGRMAPFRVDLRTGVLTMLTQTAALDARSLCLDEREKLLYLIDGGVLKEITLSSKRVQVLAENVSAFNKSAAGEFVVVRQGRLEELKAGEGPLAEEVSSWCLIRPGSKGCLFGRETSGELRGEEREFWYVSIPGASESKPTLLAKGRISDPFWSPDGRSLLLLRDVEGPSPGLLFSEVHEIVPETGEERRIDRTSQFAAFAPNGDASVFVGASRSKAQPTVILLLRSAQRELTLCEHRASHAAAVGPVFSPDSRRVYFQSDHEGRSAVYSVNVELLVEPTAPGSV